MLKTLFLFLFLLPFFVSAKVKKFDVYSSELKKFSFKRVCQIMKKDTLIVDSFSTNALDCMGDEVSINSFCRETLKKENKLSFLRGFIEKDGQQVVCQSGRKSILSITCDGNYKSYCMASSKISCGKLKKIFSEDLKLEHSSIIEDAENVKILNCYFGQGIKDEKLTSRM